MASKIRSRSEVPCVTLDFLDRIAPEAFSVRNSPQHRLDGVPRNSVSLMSTTDRPPLAHRAYEGDAVVNNSTDPVARAFIRGDADALRSVYERHGSLVHTLCARTVGGETAADVTQEVFLAAWKSRGNYDPTRGSLAGWLVGIARFKVISHLRKSGRIPQPTDILLEIAADTSHVDLIADQLLIRAAMNELPMRMRDVVTLAFFNDLTHDQIATKTGLPIGTVKSDIRRGLLRLRAIMEANDDGF